MHVIKKAWTEEAIAFDGQYYKVPFPYEEGIRRWPVAEWTRAYGAPGEIDDDGVLRKVSVVPRPFQQPHPPLFQPFSMSEKTIRYTAKSGIVPWIFLSYPQEFQRLCHIYQEDAAKAGRQLKLGENVGAFRAVHLGTTEDAAVSLLRATNYSLFMHCLGPFGFWNALGRTPEDTAKYGEAQLPHEEWTVERMRRLKYALAGTPEQVRAAVEDVATIHGHGGELEWFGWFFDQGAMPLGQAKEQLELFGEHVIRRCR